MPKKREERPGETWGPTVKTQAEADGLTAICSAYDLDTDAQALRQGVRLLSKFCELTASGCEFAWTDEHGEPADGVEVCPNDPWSDEGADPCFPPRRWTVKASEGARDACTVIATHLEQDRDGLVTWRQVWRTAMVSVGEVCDCLESGLRLWVTDAEGSVRMELL